MRRRRARVDPSPGSVPTAQFSARAARTASRTSGLRWLPTQFRVKLPADLLRQRRLDRNYGITRSSLVDMTTSTSAGSIRIPALPRWMDRLFFALVIYAVAGTECLLSGVGGPAGNRWLGMFVTLPAGFTGVVSSGAMAPR